MRRRSCPRPTACRCSVSTPRASQSASTGDRFVAGDESFTGAALESEAQSNPERFSPNVLLRPLVQDTLFPTICYVAGPSELAYLGQLGEVYRHFDLPMPLIHPRATATLVDSATARFLQKYDVPLEDLQPQDEATLNRLLEAQLPPTVDAAFNDAESAIRRSMERVVDAVASVDPTLASAAKTTLGKMDHELKALRGKVIQAAKKRDETLRRQFIRAQATDLPAGSPAGAHAVGRLLPQPLWAGADRPAAGGAAHGPGAALGVGDLA